MGTQMDKYDISIIRELIIDSFTVEDLRSFCRYKFKDVYNMLSESMGKMAIADRLIEYCERQVLLDELLKEVKKANPRRFAQYAPRLGLPPDAFGIPEMPPTASNETPPAEQPSTPGLQQSISVGGGVGGTVIQSGRDVNINLSGDTGRSKGKGGGGTAEQLRILQERADALRRDMAMEMDGERKYILQQRLKSLEQEIEELTGGS